MFYATEENRDSLKDVENRSELINRLLNEHFAIVKAPELPLEKLKELKEVLIAKEEADKKAKEILKDGGI